MQRFLAVVLIVFATPALAGQMSGTIREDTKPVPGLLINVTCGMERAQAVTDERGRYRIYVNGTGRCRFELPARQASTWIESSDMMVRQDFSLSGRDLHAR